MTTLTDQMEDAVGAVLSTLVDFPMMATEHETPGRDDMLTGIVTLSGAVDAVVMLRCDAELAAEIASSMFALPVQQLETGDIVDALGEVTNMVGGSVKVLLEGTCRLGLPIVTAGAPQAVVVPGTRTASRTVFAHESRCLSLDVMLADEDTAIGRWVDRITGK